MQLMTIGEVAERAGVTVRTLHHYEQLGLVEATTRTASGHRRYGRGAIERLQRVKSLQQLGLGLAEIGRLMAGEALSPARIVAEQLERLRAQREALDRLEAQLRRLARLLEAGASDDDEAVMVFLKTLEEMTMYDKFLTTEQRQIIDDHHATAGPAAEAEWNAALTGLRAAMEAGTAPDDPTVQALVARWHAAAEAFAPADDGALHDAMLKAMHEEPQALADHGLDAELFAFIGRAAAAADHA
ncbi:MAG: MerR family transcriptional regulator [Deltaproteobacteria bacterium]|nr:MAG: MerR family transcriptional regulator [Deltaproteobacteria bacterium]